VAGRVEARWRGGNLRYRLSLDSGPDSLRVSGVRDKGDLRAGRDSVELIVAEAGTWLPEAAGPGISNLGLRGAVDWKERRLRLEGIARMEAFDFHKPGDFLPPSEWEWTLEEGERGGRLALRLRLDANGALPPLELDRWLAVFAELEPEFIEEPCALEQLGSPRRLSVPLAFDETLSRAPLAGALAAWLQSGAVRAIVVKPMLLGGITQSLGWFHVARQHGQEVIVSHLFDGSVAAAMYRQLARFASPQLAMGLGSHDGLRLWQHVRLSPAVDGSAPSQLNRSSNL
jgi:hypothetical protein